jgi:hypothetical protein
MAVMRGVEIAPVHFVRGRRPRDTWTELVRFVAAKGHRKGDKRKLFNTIVVVDEPAPLSAELQSRHAALAGAAPWERTERLYTTVDDFSWKRSYRGRITGIREGGTQLSDAVALVASRPGTSSACCLIGRPEDIRRARVIASTVPSPLAIDLKSDCGLVNMTVFFRAQDVFRLGLPDMHYLAALQPEMLGEINQLRTAKHRSTSAAAG